MRTWIKATLAGASLLALGFLALAGTGGYYVFKSMQKTAATEAAAIREIDSIKARFGARPPLVEIINPRSVDVRINRLAGTDGGTVKTIHVVNWKAEDGEVMRMEVPLWLLRFSSVNIFSQLGLAPENLRLTVQDIERYGPGVVVDYNQPGASRLLMWVD